MHKSRLGQVIIDCETQDLDKAAEFWAKALGSKPERVSPRYIWLHGRPEEAQVIVQQVDHDSRVHIDIETNDTEAEIRRLEALGATVVERMERWVVMEAPSKQKFCIVKQTRPDFDQNANEWD